MSYCFHSIGFGGRVLRAPLAKICLLGHHLRLTIPALLSLGLLACSEERHCDLVKRQDCASPDRQHIAVVFEMCCYDTTGYYPQVSLLRSGEKLGDIGNILSGTPGDVFSVTWTAVRNLLVEYHPDGRWGWYPPATTNIDGVSITFQRK